MPRRLQLTPAKSRLLSRPWRVNLPPSISGSGKRERHFFQTCQDAETFCRQQRTRLQNFGRNSTSLTPVQLEDAAQAFAKLQPHGLSLNEVVASFLSQREAMEKSVTFKTLFERFVASKHGKSEAYLRGLRYTLPRFPRLHDCIVTEILPSDIDAEMNEMTAAVKNAFLRNLRAVFNFAVKRDWLATNPIEKLDFETLKKTEVVTLSPKEAATLMAAAENHFDLLPYHALGLFAGIRPMELERLDWQHIDLTERHIEITAEVSKTGRRRIIEMEPNLVKWLSRFAGAGGEMKGKLTPSTNLRSRLREVRTDAGIEKWTQDVMRHSYASYWLAEHGDINRLTLNMGHESSDMLWRHYHKASKRKDAERYWQITPSTRSGKVISFA
jgi:integrase